LAGEQKHHVSSDTGKRGVCGHCGARLVWQALPPEDDWLTNLSVGTLDRPADARMTRDIYADTQPPWHTVCEDLPKLTSREADRLFELLRQELRPERR
jgi:hypothetical protein